MISWEDFTRVDIRVGTVVEAEDFPGARKPSFRMLIDFGTEIGRKKSSAQLTGLYRSKDLVGRQVLGVVNFPPKQIADFRSECLILGLYAETGAVVLIQPDHPVANGSRVG